MLLPLRCLVNLRARDASKVKTNRKKTKNKQQTESSAESWLESVWRREDRETSLPVSGRLLLGLFQTCCSSHDVFRGHLSRLSIGGLLSNTWRSIVSAALEGHLSTKTDTEQRTETGREEERRKERKKEENQGLDGGRCEFVSADPSPSH